VTILSPGQFCLQLLRAGKKYLPDSYCSDLQAEFDKIWAKQQEPYPEIFIEKLKENLQGKNEKATWTICKEHFIRAVISALFPTEAKNSFSTNKPLDNIKWQFWQKIRM
jgi:hypothetical protein